MFNEYIWYAVQLEEDRNETQRLLAHEQSARALQEDLLNSHLRKQQDIEEKKLRNLTKSNEVMVKLYKSDANWENIIPGGIMCVTEVNLRLVTVFSRLHLS